MSGGSRLKGISGVTFIARLYERGEVTQRTDPVMMNGEDLDLASMVSSFHRDECASIEALLLSFTDDFHGAVKMDFESIIVFLDHDTSDRPHDLIDRVDGRFLRGHERGETFFRILSTLLDHLKRLARRADRTIFAD